MMIIPDDDDLVLLPLGNGTLIAVSKNSAQEKVLSLRLALTRARDTLERYRDPLVRELDKVLAE